MMNDRFKFRFWHKPTNKMLDCYGFNEHCTFANTLDGIGTEYNPCATKDCELMQSTGLKDKNGNLIYEGDIVKANYITPSGKEIEKICTVKFDRCAYWIDDKYSAFYLDNENCVYEVIGNIYENEELWSETTQR